MAKQAFTLIELLIVVAIISILAAIAVPNFMNAQLRAKISRCYADGKAIIVAVEQLRLDKGVMLVDFWDDDKDWGPRRVEEVFNNVGGRPEATRRQVDVLAPLTSPISYLSSIPHDPFAPKMTEAVSGGHSERFGLKGNETYLYADCDYEDQDGSGYGNFRGGDRRAIDLKRGEFCLFGFGPAANRNYSGSNGIRWWIPFDASNGIRSDGDIMMHNSGGPVKRVEGR